MRLKELIKNSLILVSELVFDHTQCLETEWLRVGLASYITQNFSLICDIVEDYCQVEL